MLRVPVPELQSISAVGSAAATTTPPIPSSNDDAACRQARMASGDCRTCGDVSSQRLMAPARLTGSGSQSIVWGIPDNCSDRPPTRVAITGRPAAIAAAATPLWLASWYGKISASAQPKTVPISVSAAQQFSTITLWQARSASRSPHSRPRPTIRTAIGVSGGNNLIAPASRSSPLYGRSRPKNNRRGGPGGRGRGGRSKANGGCARAINTRFEEIIFLSLQLRSDMAAQRHQTAGATTQQALQGHLHRISVAGMHLGFMHHDQQPDAQQAQGRRHNQIQWPGHRANRDIRTITAQPEHQQRHRQRHRNKPGQKRDKTPISTNRHLAARRVGTRHDFRITAERQPYRDTRIATQRGSETDRKSWSGAAPPPLPNEYSRRVDRPILERGQCSTNHIGSHAWRCSVARVCYRANGCCALVECIHFGPR